MSIFTPDDLIEQAAWFADMSAKFAECAVTLRDAAEKMRSANATVNAASRYAGEPDKRDLIAAITSSEEAKALMTSRPLTHLSVAGKPRLEQLNTILRMIGPMSRLDLINYAWTVKIPKNTSAAMITRENFAYKDGFWWIKDTEWPPFRSVNGEKIPFDHVDAKGKREKGDDEASD
jgi:hypothetical protein